MKKLFVFEPSGHWQYCGGGRVAIAESIEEIQGMDWLDDFGAESTFVTEDSKHGIGIWVLVETFEVEEQPSRIVLDNYNWA